MAITTCKECGKQVSTEAKTCPHCGAAAPAKKKAKGGVGKWLLIVFAVGVVAAILSKQDKTQVLVSSSPKTQVAPTPATSQKVEAKRAEEKSDEVTERQRAALASLKAQLEAQDQRIAAAREDQRKSWDAKNSGRREAAAGMSGASSV